MFPCKERKCLECGSTHFVVDHAAGDIICKGCALVVEAHIIVESAEWRTFSDTDKPTGDPNRVGGPYDELLADAGLSTMIGKGAGTRLHRTQDRITNQGKALREAGADLTRIAVNLRFDAESPVIRIAKELYKLVFDSEELKGHKRTGLYTAAMYLACVENRTPRTFKQVLGALPSPVRQTTVTKPYRVMSDLAKASGRYPYITDKCLAENVTAGFRHPEEYIKKFVADLKLGREVLKACTDMALVVKDKAENVESAKNPWDHRQPLSLAATIVYTVTLVKDPVPMQDICTVTNVAEATIKLVYRDFYPSLAKLLPPGYNSPEQIAKLPAPGKRSADEPAEPPKPRPAPPAASAAAPAALTATSRAPTVSRASVPAPAAPAAGGVAAQLLQLAVTAGAAGVDTLRPIIQQAVTAGAAGMPAVNGLLQLAAAAGPAGLPCLTALLEMALTAGHSGCHAVAAYTKFFLAAQAAGLPYITLLVQLAAAAGAAGKQVLKVLIQQVTSSMPPNAPLLAALMQQAAAASGVQPEQLTVLVPTALTAGAAGMTMLADLLQQNLGC